MVDLSLFPILLEISFAPHLCWIPCLSLSWFTYWFWWNSTSRSFLRNITRKIKSFEIIHVWRKRFPNLLCEWWPDWVRYHLLSEYWWVCSIIFFQCFLEETKESWFLIFYMFLSFLEAWIFILFAEFGNSQWWTWCGSSSGFNLESNVSFWKLSWNI